MNTNNGKYFLSQIGCFKITKPFTFISYNEINSNGGEFVTKKIELAKTLNITERKKIGTILTKMS
jgi:predicted phosphatase